VFVRRDPKTGDVILSRKPDSWDGLLELHQSADVPDDFMGPSDRNQSRAFALTDRRLGEMS
jgi:antitoxin VapB